MPHPTSGGSLPTPLPDSQMFAPQPAGGASPPCPVTDWQECLVELLEEHRRKTIADIAAQLEPLYKVLKTGSLLSELNKLGNFPSALQGGDEVGIHSRGLLSRGSESTATVATALPPKNPRKSSHVQRMSQRIANKLEQKEQRKRFSIPESQVKDVVAEVQHVFTDHPQSKGWQLMPILDIVIAVIISLNVVFMIVELQHQSYQSEVILGKVAKDSAWNNAKTWFAVIEHLFNAVYLVELGLRFWLLRFSYFQSSMNCVDLSLVLLTSFQIYLLEPLGAPSGGQLTLFRMLRFFRLVRVLKILRLRTFTALRVLVQTCISSMAALGWSMVLLFVIIIMSGIFLCNLLNAEMQDNSRDHGLRMWLYRYYGTPLRATYTLFEVTLAGCWPEYFRPLVERVNGWYSMYVIGYISIVVFAVIRIITAIFLKQTLSVASNDADMVIIEQKTKTQQTIQKFAKVFQTLDASRDGLLHWEEFQVILSNSEVKGWLATLDVLVHDAEGLFQLLDDGDGAITYEEFLAGMMRLKGQAKSLDLVALSRHCDKIEDSVLTIEAKVDWMVDCFRHSQSICTH